VSRSLYRLGALCVRRKYPILVVWGVAVVLVLAGVLAFGARINNDIRLPGTGAQRASDLLSEAFPARQYGESPIVFHVTHGRLTDAANKRAIERSLGDIANTSHVSSVISPFSPAGRTLVSPDGRTAVAQVLLDINGFQITKDLAGRVLSGADPARRAGIQVEAGGDIGAQVSQTSTRRSELIGVVAALIILAFTFACLVAAGLPVVTALVGLGIGLGLVGLLGHLLAVPTVAPKLATMIGLGVGIDYALFIVFRHRDQLRAGMDVRESVARTLATSGSAVVFAGATVIVALLALLVAHVPMLGAMGYAAALTVLVAVLTAVTLLPAMLALLGHRIDGLPLFGGRRAARTSGAENVWARWAGFVTSHPWAALVAALLVLGPLAAPTLTLKLGQADVGVTPASMTQRRAFDLISAGLGPGANEPLLIAAQFVPVARPSSVLTTAGKEAEHLRRRIEAGRRSLAKKAAALKGQQAALRAEAADLQGQSAWLRTQRSSLQTQAATLQEEQARLLGQKRRLTAEKRRLRTESEALAAQGQALATQMATVQQGIAASQDPTEIAELQTELAALVAQVQTVQAKTAALEEAAVSLARQATRLQTQGRGLAAQAGALNAGVAALQAQAARLEGQGDALKRQSSDLERRAARLRRKQRQLRWDVERAQALKAELTRILTKAGGQPRATDPRVVGLQDALSQTSGVASVSPPQVNKSGAAAVFAVTATTRPADPRTIDLVNRLRDTVMPGATRGEGVTAFVGGATAAWGDLATLISRRLPLVIATVLALSFLLLLVAFRSVLVPLKAILCNLLAVAAAFGVLTVAFQWGWGLRFVGLSNPYASVPIASYVPLLMFAVLFGMSTDYEVFLISQIFQFHAAGQGPNEAVRCGVGTSARVITAAAAIMVTVFASFILNGDPVIKQFGVGLSIAILLDATIVRMVIVPAAMALLGEWNWYLPRWLQWLPRIDLPEAADASALPPFQIPAAGERAVGATQLSSD
jgi:uncharacterized membrane protein YdfJ with MMPL/SSD domain